MRFSPNMPAPRQPPATLSFQSSDSGSSFDSRPGKRLEIAFLVPEDRQTGTYFRYHNLAIALQQLGHKVTVYSQSSQNRFRRSRELRDGVPYVLSATVPGNRWILPPTNPVNLLRRWMTPVAEADVYHLFQPFPTAALTWLRLKRHRKGLFVYDWDDFWINEEFGLKNPRGTQARWAACCLKRLEASLPGKSHLTTTVSRPLADLATQRKSPRSTVIYNGVWPQPLRDKRASRTALGLDPEALYVGLMGWSGEVEWCLEAMRRFSSQFPKLRLAITGRDPGDILTRYEDIRSRIDYLGALPNDRFVHFNPSLDLGLVPMRASEFNEYRLPYKLTDHLAGGTPVLCTRIGEVIQLADALPGVESCPPDLDSWLDHFEKIVHKLQESPDALQFSTESLLQRFSWLEIASQITDVYEKSRKDLAHLSLESSRRASETPTAK